MRFYAFLLLLPLFVFAENNLTKSEPIKLQQILIQGNSNIKTSEYLDALGVKSKGWFEFWKSDKNYISKKAAGSISDTLRDFLDSKGYYDAKIKVEKQPDLVTVDITENNPVIIDKIEIQSDFNISSVMLFKENGRFEASKFISIKSNIKKELMKAGYCNYQLDTKAFVDLDKRVVSLKYQLQKGELCRFGKTIIVNKPDNISEQVILSRVQYHKGDVFSTERVSETFGALNQLDAFDSGTVAPKQRDDNAPKSQVIPMEISLSKKEKLNIFKGGVGYDTAVGMRAQLFYERRNFMGDARKLTTALHYSKKKKFAEVSLFSPALLMLNGDHFDLFAKLGFSHDIYDKYDENRGYLDIKLSYERGDMDFYLGLGLENIDIKLNEPDPAIIPGNFLLLYPFVEFIYDGRDSQIDPKNGYYFSAYVEYGLDYKPEASSYLKYLLEGRLIKSFGDLTLAAVGKIGVVDELAGDLPASKLFYAGGAYSNRAYGEHDIGYTLSPVASAALGGKTWLNLSLEADYPLYKELSGALFWDSTMISKGTYDFTSPVIHSAGVGVRYATPVGPVKLDVGVNVEDIEQYGIHFQIGQSF